MSETEEPVKESRFGMNQFWATVFVALFSFFGIAVKTAHDDRLVMLGMVTDLRAQVDQLQSLKQSADLSALDLKYQLRTTISQMDVVQAFLDSLPLPAWVKRKREDGQFEMVALNTAYVQRFDITKFEYVGKTDFDIWPPGIAEVFKLNDDEVYNRKRRKCVAEDVFLKGIRESVFVCKFPLLLDHVNYGVGGVITTF